MKSLQLVLCFLLAFGFSHALEYKIENVNIIAFPNETLEYKVIITNNESTTKQVYINKLFVENLFEGRNVNVSPSINQAINPGESKTVSISIPVTEDLAKGVYRTIYKTYLVVSADGITENVPINAVILSRDEWAGAVQNITVILPNSINPTEGFNVTITSLCNLKSLFSVFKFIVSSDSGIIYSSESSHELVHGINVIEKEVKIPDSTAPGVYFFIVSTELPGSLLNQGVSNFVVNEISLVNESMVVIEDLFGKTVTKSIVNEGNNVINISVNYTAKLLEPLLVTSSGISIDGELVTKPVFDGYFASSVIQVLPGESVVLSISFGYGPLIIAPFIVLLVVIGWFFITKRVSIGKEIIECVKEDGELMIKVGISVRNVSTKSISDVRVVEDLPVFAKKAGGFGTIKGDVDKDKGVINFSVGRLDSKEEVLISYKFKTDVELVGRISLPPASAKFSVDGKVVVLKSNTPIVQLIKG